MSSGNKIAVIGTAGRDNHEALTFGGFERMKVLALSAIEQQGFGPAECTLVSGGAPWADHVAVELFLEGKVAGLELYLPGQLYDRDDTTAGIRPVESSARKDASVLVGYHRSFAEKTGIKGLDRIREAERKGAVIMSADGFFARNDMIAANCDAMIALHTNETHPNKQKRGGTKYTFKKAAVPKIYVPITATARTVKALTNFTAEEKSALRQVFNRQTDGPLDEFFKPVKRQKTLVASSAS